MTEVYASAIYGEGWCPKCSNPSKSSYIYHLGSDCPTPGEIQNIIMGNPTMVNANSFKQKKPYIGGMVHFITSSGYHRPAIIVDVHDQNVVDLQVFGSAIYNEPNMEFKNWVTFEPMPNIRGQWLYSWHWPEET